MPDVDATPGGTVVSVLAPLLTTGSGAGATPLIIVGVIAAYLTTRLLSRPDAGAGAHA